MCPTNHHSPQSPRGSRRAPAGPRRGIAVVFVLGLVAITIAVSYALVWTETTNFRVESNVELRDKARQAAHAGVMVALRRMHDQNWPGVGTMTSGPLGANERFEARYVAGDDSLKPGTPEYADYPYRVTIASTGYASEPNSTAPPATHQLSAVVRLAPRKLGDEPTDWATMLARAVFQTRERPFKVNFPIRISGSVFILGQMVTAEDYPNTALSRTQYLADLGLMKLAGIADYRPYEGPLLVYLANQTAQTLNQLLDLLKINVSSADYFSPAADWELPTSVSTYQLYPGGPVYEVPTIPSTISNTTLAPDVATNPLGVFYNDGSVTLGDNVIVQGSLFARDEIRLDGTGINVTPVDIQPLEDSTGETIRLPAASCEDFRVEAGASGEVHGVVAVFGKFNVDRGGIETTLELKGHLILEELDLEGYSAWANADWAALHTQFLLQLPLALLNPYKLYFPLWLEVNAGLDPRPLVEIKLGAGNIIHHWLSATVDEPVYDVHPDDDGLRWKLLRLKDNS